MNHLEKIRELYQNATPGPWITDGDTVHEGDCQSQHRPIESWAGQFCDCRVMTRCDAKLVVALHKAWPEIQIILGKLEILHQQPSEYVWSVQLPALMGLYAKFRDESGECNTTIT